MLLQGQNLVPNTPIYMVFKTFGRKNTGARGIEFGKRKILGQKSAGPKKKFRPWSPKFFKNAQIGLKWAKKSVLAA